MTNKTYYQRKLPHYHPPGENFFITYRLVDSIPKLVLEKFKETYIEVIENPNAYYTGKDYNLAKRLFIEADHYLDSKLNGPYWLQDDAIASIVANSLHSGHNKNYLLNCFSIMSNHVHVLLKHIDTAPSLSKILQMHKGATAFECNKILNRNGQFWDRESYDRVVRNTVEFERIKNYILNNPVKAGLVQDWRDWKWNYLAG